MIKLLVTQIMPENTELRTTNEISQLMLTDLPSPRIEGQRLGI